MTEAILVLALISAGMAIGHTIGRWRGITEGRRIQRHISAEITRKYNTQGLYERHIWN